MLLWLALSAAVQAQYSYTTNNGAITISGYTGSGGAVTIPDTIDGLPVTSIGDSAFFGCTSLTNLTVANSVTSIGDCAFGDCTGLTSVTIGNSVTGIGWGAFVSCTGLTSVTIPNGVTSIGVGTFNGCTSLTSVTIPKSVNAIGDEAFYGCSGLTSVTIPDSVTTIGNEAFYGCSGLTSVTIPNSITSLGLGALDWCDNLSAITVDALNPAYSSVDGVLFNHDQSTLIRYPRARAGSQYSIPTSVTNIGGEAFVRCYQLTSVTIPDSVINIGFGAFVSCTGLTSITIPDGVTSIESAFSGCSGLTSVMIPNSVTSIGSYAFCDCISLTSVTIPDSVTGIGDAAFVSCTGLTSVTIPDRVTSIRDNAFDGCDNLQEVYFQGDAPVLGNSVFYGDDKATVYYSPETEGWTSTFGGRPALPWNPAVPATYTISDDTVTITKYIGPGGTVTIPYQIQGLPVAKLGDGAFAGCTNLTALRFLGNAPTLGESVFAGIDNATVYHLAGRKGWSPTLGGLPAFLWEPSVPVAYSTNNGLVTLTRYLGPGGVVTIPYQIQGLPVTEFADGAFAGYTNLTALYVEGNASGTSLNVFNEDAQATVYYLPGTTGWGATLGGLPTALWPLPMPSILTLGASFGVQTNGFGFLSWATNLTVVVEASTNLAQPNWTPLETNTLAGGSAAFSDPGWTNFPARFYRLRFP